ncbi:ABC transporter permease [Streptococcus iniae]|uniref:ABC transporter permease n=1 Tax=Streptococcus iniae TaxID=1346 RepID=UPI002B30A2FC|nr:ABC transporter permease [Streptococcus iniae]
MEQLFRKRRLAFQKRQLKYLPYVFNDHFVLVLMFLLGYLLYQYSQLLAHFPKNRLAVILVLISLVQFLLGFGQPATYLEASDSHYLLVKEEEVLLEIKKSGKDSFILWGTFQTLCLVLLAPIFLKLGLSVVSIGIVILLLLVVKWFIQDYKINQLKTPTGLNWKLAIEKERHRQQKILTFYSLFTNVKGITSGFKERPYLTGLLSKLPQKSTLFWTHLYARAFLRSADYLGLFIRLLLLSSLALWFIQPPYLATILASLCNYLLLFQLLALYHHFDYHYLTSLYPVTPTLKKKNLLLFLRGISLVLWLVEMLLSHSLLNIIITCVFLLLNLFYLPYKLKNIID